MTHAEKEELGNAISHGLGFVAALLGLVVLIYHSMNSVYPMAEVSAIVYGISLLVLYFASTFYHINWKSSNKLKWQKFDHISIYILIAGTYTPFTMISLAEESGWLLFGIIWGIALSGTIYKLFFMGKFKYFSLIAYVLMSWLIIFDINTLSNNVSSHSLFFIFLGGAFYTVGAVFYAWKKLPFNHFIWHLFVLGGSISHYFAVLDVYN